MRRVMACALMIILCLALIGCAGTDGQAEQAALNFRTGLLGAGGCDMTAKVVADYGDRVYEYTLECDYRRNAESLVKVVEPGVIAGVTVSVNGMDTALSFDGLNLDTGALDDSQITPVGCLPAIALAWEEGYISNCCYEKLGDLECVLVSCLVGYDSQQLKYNTWFDKASMNPVKSEIISGSKRIISCEFLNYNKTEGTDNGQITKEDLG